MGARKNLLFAVGYMPPLRGFLSFCFHYQRTFAYPLHCWTLYFTRESATLSSEPGLLSVYTAPMVKRL
jgi:hypothetical protein